MNKNFNIRPSNQRGKNRSLTQKKIDRLVLSMTAATASVYFFNISKISNTTFALCGICPNPHKSIELQFSKNYLTTKDPFLVRIQKIQKFRKIYSPDPDSGSGIPEI